MKLNLWVSATSGNINRNVNRKMIESLQTGSEWELTESRDEDDKNLKLSENSPCLRSPESQDAFNAPVCFGQLSKCSLLLFLLELPGWCKSQCTLPLHISICVEVFVVVVDNEIFQPRTRYWGASCQMKDLYVTLRNSNDPPRWDIDRY